MSEPALLVEGVRHRYGDFEALADVSFQVAAGELFGLLGPNGGGKSTFFQILTTLLPVQEGQISVFGFDVKTQPDPVRRAIGVTFQSASLDQKLTVYENLKHQGHLYGLTANALRSRIGEVLDRVRLRDREKDLAASLSGGMQRRLEIAKGLLHRPRLLVLDEPTTGLDPVARNEIWEYLAAMREETGVTILATTHILEEADTFDRLAILDRGNLVALGAPEELKNSLGGDCLTIRTRQPEQLSRQITERFSIEPRRVAGVLRIERENGHELLRDLVAAFPDEVDSISLGKPTLEDVFIDRTGHRFEHETETTTPGKKNRRGKRRKTQQSV